MHAAVCLLRAGQPRSAGDAAKLGQFIGQFSWVTGDPIGVKGLSDSMNSGLHEFVYLLLFLLILLLLRCLVEEEMIQILCNRKISTNGKQRMNR